MTLTRRPARARRAAHAAIAMTLASTLAACVDDADTTTPRPAASYDPPVITPLGAQIGVATTGGPADAFTTTDSVTVRITAATDEVLPTLTFKLNGTDVTRAFAAGGQRVLQGTLTGLMPGPNVLVVTDTRTGQVTYARRTLTRSVPMMVDCASLAGLRIPATAIGEPTTGATVTTAVVVAAVTAPVVTGSVTQLPTPQFCQVNGAIAPVDATAPPINFQVNLPVAWNQKVAQMGGSGYNGVMPRAMNGANMRYGPESLPPDAPYAVTRGYATYASDSGHQGNATTWALNAESFANYGYLQVKKTHDVALQVVQAAYGTRPRKSYHLGTSTGGREALQAAQRYADDYDGILSQLPVIAWPEMFAYQSIKYRQAQTGNGWIPPAKIAAIDAEVRRQCDALDGLVDGYNASTFECNALFDPQRVANPWAAIRCSGGQDTGSNCLSDPQIATLNLFHAPNRYPYTLSNGITAFEGWPVGGESTANGLYQRTQPLLSAANAPDAFLVATVGSTSFNVLNFRPEDYVAGVQYVASTVYATNPDLGRFRSRGGKLLMKANSTDYVANPRMITQYYQSVVAKMGQAAVDEFVRYYTVIGAWHGNNVGQNTVTGATAPYYVDFIEMLDRWVEDGIVPPDNATVTLQNTTPPFDLVSSLPMCRYPTTPRYVGGDQSRAGSYACR